MSIKNSFVMNNQVRRPSLVVVFLHKEVDNLHQRKKTQPPRIEYHLQTGETDFLLYSPPRAIRRVQSVQRRCSGADPQ